MWFLLSGTHVEDAVFEYTEIQRPTYLQLNTIKEEETSGGSCNDHTEGQMPEQ